MPNNITNRLTVNGSPKDVAAVFDYIKSDTSKEDRLIDFNKIVPMPESLNIPKNSITEEAEAYVIVHERMGVDPRIHSYNKFFHYESIKDDAEKVENYLRLGRQANDNRLKHHFPTWYEWSLANWGTKWNAYDAEIVSCDEEYYDAITFRTAWNGVPYLIAKLAEKFPNVSMNYIFADENYGYNTGIYELQGSEIKGGSPEDASKEAWQIVFELGLVDPDELIEQPDRTYR